MGQFDSASSLAGNASPWGAAANLASGLISAGVGALQRHASNKWLAANPTPIEGMPSEVTQNQALAQGMAGQGLPSEQYNKAMQDIQRSQLLALRSSQDRRGATGLISSVQGGTNDATVNLNARDAAMRVQNQRNLMAVNNQVAGWKHNLYNSNVRQPYNMNYKYRMGELGAGNANLVGGLDKISTGAFKLAGSGYLGGGVGTSYSNQGAGEAWG